MGTTPEPWNMDGVADDLGIYTSVSYGGDLALRVITITDTLGTHGPLFGQNYALGTVSPKAIASDVAYALKRYKQSILASQPRFPSFHLPFESVPPAPFPLLSPSQYCPQRLAELVMIEEVSIFLQRII